MRAQAAALLVAVGAASFLGACSTSEQSDASSALGSNGQLHLALTGDPSQLVTIAVRSVFDPTQVWVVDCPAKDHLLNGQQFCDELVVLPPGVYEIVVQSQDPSCKTELDHYKVVVQEGETTEVQINLVCQDSTGGLDVVVTTQNRPNVSHIDFTFLTGGGPANKYMCQCADDVKIEVDVQDADTACAGLTGTWKAVNSSGADVTAMLLSSPTADAGPSPCEFYVNVDSSLPLGTYQITFTVSDGTTEPATFKFPLHFIDCGNTCGACPTGTIQCGNTCVDPLTDENNCGSCGNACAAGATCLNGTCVPGCPAGQQLCGTVCVNLQTDTYNCGACGNACPQGTTCQQGACTPVCPQGQVLCGTVCVDTQTSEQNCGACGVACAPNALCVSGVCTPCASGLSACGDLCVDLQNDGANCGACGVTCPSWATCQAGTCQPPCPPGQTLCGSVCVDTQTDEQNCGTCGLACNPAAQCINGTCIDICGPGEVLCGNVCVDLLSDQTNCGACGNVCASGTLCVNGACAACPSGENTCGNMCVDLNTDEQNCGACGTTCAPGRECVAGACVCPSGTTACNGYCADLQNDTHDCGACFNQCPAGNACVSGACVPTCPAGETLCSGACVDTQTDELNCGACGVTCAGDQTCVSGGCTDICSAPTAALSITSSFNGTAISAGNYIWFNSVFNDNHSGAVAEHVYFRNLVATFTANSVNYTVPLPDALVTFDPAATTATTTLSGGVWNTVVPMSVGSDVFLSGIAWQVPVNLPGGVDVTITGTVSADFPINLSWKWAAAVYTQFPDAASPAVKAVSATGYPPYIGSEHAGVPMDDKAWVIGGARGGGGSNWTGSYSGTQSTSAAACP